MGHIINNDYVNALRLLDELESKNKITTESKEILTKHFTDCFISNKKNLLVWNYFTEHSDYYMPILRDFNNQLENLFQRSISNHVR